MRLKILQKERVSFFCDRFPQHGILFQLQDRFRKSLSVLGRDKESHFYASENRLCRGAFDGDQCNAACENFVDFVRHAEIRFRGFPEHAEADIGIAQFFGYFFECGEESMEENVPQTEILCALSHRGFRLPFADEVEFNVFDAVALNLRRRIQNCFDAVDGDEPPLVHHAEFLAWNFLLCGAEYIHAAGDGEEKKTILRRSEPLREEFSVHGGLQKHEIGNGVREPIKEEEEPCARVKTREPPAIFYFRFIHRDQPVEDEYLSCECCEDPCERHEVVPHKSDEDDIALPMNTPKFPHEIGVFSNKSLLKGPALKNSEALFREAFFQNPVAREIARQIAKEEDRFHSFSIVVRLRYQIVKSISLSLSSISV